jgi:DNA-binding NarL/FixJ family response regulator
MKDPADNRRFTAMIVTGSGKPCPGLQAFLWERGFYTKNSVASEALDACRSNPPDLAIVQDDLGPITGTQFLSQLLGVTWRTSTILITDLDEETVHERTEGLGILGAVRDCEDYSKLTALLETFFNIVS